MELWTIQTEAAWEQLRQTGVLRGSTRFAFEDFLPAYSWLKAEMARRIGAPPEPDTLPVWAWYQWEGRRKQPDLREARYLARGTLGVCLEVEVPAESVLLSDFDLWHFVLNHSYLPLSLEDQASFHALCDEAGPAWTPGQPLPHPAFPQRIEASWQRIFDLDWHAKDITCRREERSIQATFWELRREHIRRAQPFCAR